MSAKDVRNIWERIFSYFERLLTGKTKEGDWVILLILLSVIFVLALCYGGPVGGFTFILAIATIWNIRITRGLLKQSREAFKQSRISFLVSIVERTIEHAEENLSNHKPNEAVEYIKKKTKAINRISKEGAEEFLEAMIDWSPSLLKTELEKYKKSHFG